MSCAIRLIIAILLFLFAPGQDARDTVTSIVSRIQRADFEDDRATLARVSAELAPFVENSALASRVHYWRGFALWRRALNAQNEPTPPPGVEDDLTQAAAEFHKAVAIDPKFADAKGGEAYCLINLSVLHQKEPRGREWYVRSRALLDEALVAEPENPRLLWLLSGYEFYQPAESGGGPTKALSTQERALGLAQRQKGRTSDPLEPAWGEPELLMALAYTHLTLATPDVAAAERYAQRALALVPYWHFVRDILMQRIQNAKAKA